MEIYLIYLIIGFILAAIYYALVIANAIKPFGNKPIHILSLGVYDINDEYANSNGDLFMLLMLSIFASAIIMFGWGFFLTVGIVYLIVKGLRDYKSPWNSTRY